LIHAGILTRETTREAALPCAVTSSGDDYLRPTVADIALLPEHLSKTAKVTDRGEAEWPRELAEEVIRSLVGLGRVVNVLQCARYDGDTLVQANPVSTYEGSSAEANLQWILPGLALLTDDASAIVCWYPGE
jgi:hypothetical protein